MPSTRTPVVCLLVGILHAILLLAVAVELGYAVGPAAYSPVGLAWRYGGLLLVAALPAWLTFRWRLLAPAVALVLTTGYVLGAELTPPGPTFRDVAELEGLAEPTGITVVENGLYIVRYMLDASVWTVGFLFLGLVEYVARESWGVLPSVRRPIRWLSVPVPRRRAATVAAVGGTCHAVAMAWYAARLGVGLSGHSQWWLYPYGVVGMWLLAALPLSLSVRRRLVAPIAFLTAFVLLDAAAAFTATVEDPHALYFGGWFVYLAVLLAVAGVECGVRRLVASRRVASGG